MKKLFFIVIILFLFQRTTFAQCCSAGNPVGGTTNIGILDTNAVRLISFYRFSYSSGYWEGNKKSDFNFVKNANYNYIGTVVSYGLFKKLTLETELGVYINKSQTYNISPEQTLNGYGLDNGVFSLKYNLIIKTENPFEWTIGAGIKFPFTKQYQIANNVELPRDVQSSTHAFGIVAQSFLFKGFPENNIKLFFTNRLELNYPDNKNFKFGNSLITSFFIAKKIGQSKFTAIVQARHEYRAKDISNTNCASCFATGPYINSSGGNLVFIAPQINYTIAKKWNISLLTDIPVYIYYNGTQLANNFSFALYLARDFGSKCDVK